MHPRMARLLYFLGGEVHRFQNNCVEGLNCGLYLFTYLFVASCDRGGLRRPPSITSNAFMIGNKKLHRRMYQEPVVMYSPFPTWRHNLIDTVT